MFGRGKKKCEYCRSAIEDGNEIQRNVKRPGYVGTFPKSFCSEEHAQSYNMEMETASQGKGGCC